MFANENNCLIDLSKLRGKELKLKSSYMEGLRQILTI